jgi:hypothetical protein
MVSSNQLVLDDVAFVADINPMDIPQGAIDKLSLGLKWATNTTTAMTAAEGLAQLAALRIFQNGLKTEINGKELLALNALKLNISPWSLDASNTAHYRGYIGGLSLPCNIPSDKKAQLQAVFTANAVNELSTICVHASYKDKLDGPMKGYQRKPLTPTTTGAFGNRVSLAIQGAKVGGFLLFSTTIPALTATTTSLHKLRLQSEKGIISEWNWNDIGPSGTVQIGVATLDAVLKLFRWIELDEPIPADNLIADVYADDTNATVIIPEYIFG